MSSMLSFDPHIPDSYSEHVPCVICGDESTDGKLILRWFFEITGIQMEWFLMECPTCGTLRNMPQWKVNILGWVYDNIYYKDRHPVNDQYVFKILQEMYAKYEKYLDELESFKSDINTVFDVGCGMALMVLEAQSRDWNAFGCDISRNTIDFVARRLRIPNLEVGEFSFKPERENFFDLIMFNDSLEHVPHPDLQLNIAHKQMKSGGLLSLRVPNCKSPLTSWFQEFFYDPPFHLWGFNRESIKQLVERSGFKVLKLKTGGFYPGQLWCVAQKI